MVLCCHLPVNYNRPESGRENQMGKMEQAAQQLARRDAEPHSVVESMDACAGQLHEVAEELRYRARGTRSNLLRARLLDAATRLYQVKNDLMRTALGLTRLQQELQLPGGGA